MMLLSVDKAGINLHNRRELITENNIELVRHLPCKFIRITPKREIIFNAIYGSGFARLKLRSNNMDAVTVFNTVFAVTVIFRNVRLRHSSIRQSGQNRNPMTSRDKFFAYISSIKWFWPIMLAHNENIH